MSLKEIKTFGGGTLTVDISDEACEKFGFKNGDRIKQRIHKTGPWLEGTVVGVAPATESGLDPVPNVLWVILDRFGKATYSHPQTYIAA